MTAPITPAADPLDFPTDLLVVAVLTGDITRQECAALTAGLRAQLAPTREFVTAHPDRVPALIASEEAARARHAADGNWFQTLQHAAYAALVRAITEES